jgi:hypothetical protein
MRGFRGLGLFLVFAVMSCATNKDVVRDSTKNLMKKYRGEQNQRIAVFPFMTQSQQKTQELTDLDDEVMDIVFEDKKFQIVERSLMEQISKEWTFSESGMVDEEQRSKIGKLSGAKLILVPIISGKKNINMRIISVNSGDVLSYVRSTLATPIVESFTPSGRVPSGRVPSGRVVPSQIAVSGGSISLGSSANGTIGQPGQIDNYTLNLRSSKSIEIRADRTDSSFDPFLELRNSSGMTIATDDDGGEGLNAKIVSSLSPGSYTIAVKAYNVNTTGSYNLSVSESTPMVMSGGTGNFGDLMIQLETSINFSAQTDSWRGRRSGWINDVRGASGNLNRMRELVLEFETNIRSNSQNSSWLSNSRGNWVRRVRSANSIRELAVLLRECESNILYTAQSSSWSNTRANWTSQVQSLER